MVHGLQPFLAMESAQKDENPRERTLTSSRSVQAIERALRSILRNSLYAMIAALIVIASISAAAYLKLESSHTSVSRYVSVWEEEIARNLLLAGDRELFEKVLAQISDLAPEVVSATGTTESCGERQLIQKVSITLYGTPAGGLTICRSPARLAIASLQSPVFLVGIILGGLMFLWHTRRTNAERASLATAIAIEGLSKQVAHDLRSPLGALKIVGTRLSSSSESEPLVHVLQSSISRISQITEDLLDHSQATRASSADSGNTAKIVAKVPARDVIRDVVQEMKMNAETKGVQLVHTEDKTQKGLPPAVLSQEIQCRDLARVVSNLIQNAIEAPSAKQVNIATRELPSSIEIEIADNGTGIPKPNWRMLGRRGFTFGKERGHGLGVSHAKDWTNSVGGRLRVRTSQSSGTSVVLTLPR
ncbi:MAG: HAMP domain-containing sensor histidine kinase [Bdellovibrionales bacterium]|nr:HAMP domain-containing sensor histidine kinase [Bdellovibrionales bacterium]